MLTLRWTLRDLRRRWVPVAAIALLIALGTGMFTGLGSMGAWRTASNDASFAALRVHDVRVALADGADVERGELRRAVAASPVGDRVAEAEERLIAAGQVEVATPDGPVVVPASVVGVPARAEGLAVDALDASAGRLLRPTDAAAGRVMLDTGFADAVGIPPTGTVLVGGVPVPYVGLARTPEQFLLTEGEGGYALPGSYAFVYAPLPVAGRLTGHPGRVDDIVLRLTPGADPEAAAAQLEATLPDLLGGTGVTATTTEEMDAYRILYKDADGDQQLMDVFAALVLAGAALAAFNLVSRIVESQRREIGISMALGVPAWRVALRPMLMGLEIAVLGVLFGAGAGYAIQELMRGVLEDYSAALPVLVTPFQPEVWIRGTAVGLVVVLVATAIPVWRGVRVPPIRAIRVSARTARRGGAVAVAKRLRIPGGSLMQMPLRGVLRTPARSLMTALGIGAVIAVVVSLLGVWDAMGDMITRSEAATVDPAPARIVATLDGPVPVDGAVVRGVGAAEGVGASEAWLRLPATVTAGDHAPIDLLLGVPQGADAVWSPTSGSALEDDPGGILLSELAADQLGVGAGDAVTLVHPVPQGDGIGLQASRVAVAGTHPDPFRAFAYMSAQGAQRIGLGGIANSVDVVPAAGVAQADLVRELAAAPGVATAQPASATTAALRETIDEFRAILAVPIGVGLILALLIAFNSSAIGADERTRENATMFAFGLRPRAPVAIAMGESLLLGVLATAIGVGLGYLLLRWIVGVQFPEVLPEVGARAVISWGTVALAALAGVVAVTLAPLLTLPRLRRMDVPSSLRVME